MQQQPAMRFCPTCGTDVEDVGGFCMVGHSLKISAPTADLSTLRAEVDAAFEAARLQVAAVLGSRPDSMPAAPTPAVTAPSPAPEPLRLADPDPVAPPAQPVVKPPPPPPPGAAGLEIQPPVVPPASNGSDPITAFSPPPHMDWGPRRKRFGRRK